MIQTFFDRLAGRATYINPGSASRQRAWNSDGTRHDKHSFNPSAAGLEKAKIVARSALGLAADFSLEHTASGDRLLLETDGSRPKIRCVVFVAKG